MDLLLQKRLLIFFFLPLLSLLSSAYGDNAPYDYTFKSVEHLFIKRAPDLRRAPSSSLDTFLKAIKNNDYKGFLKGFEEICGPYEGIREAVCRLPLRVLPSVSGLKTEEHISSLDLEGDVMLNILQIAIKIQAFEVVHALLLQNVEYDVNRMGDSQDAATDLLMLAVTAMKDENGLKILSALIAAGVTGENKRYTSPEKGPVETPLTQLMKRRLHGCRALSQDLITKAAIVLINAGFDPYEDRFSVGSPFIQAVVAKCDPIVAMSVRCFGDQHQEDPLLMNSEKFRKEINRFMRYQDSLTTASYESMKEAALPVLGEAEKIVKDIRKELIDHRRTIIEEVFKHKGNNTIDFSDKLFRTIPCFRLILQWERNALEESVALMEKTRDDLKAEQQASTALQPFISSLEEEISWRNALLHDYHRPIPQHVVYSYVQKQHDFDPSSVSLEELDEGFHLKNFQEWRKKAVELEATKQALMQELMPHVPSQGASHTRPSLEQPAFPVSILSSSIPPAPSSPAPSSPVVQSQQGRSPEQVPAEGDMGAVIGCGILVIGLLGGISFLIKKLRSRHDNKTHKDGTDDVVEPKPVYNRHVSYS